MKWNYRYVNPHHCHHHKVHLPKAYKYAKDMEKGDKFPPVQVHMNKDGNYIIRNGAHRTMAAKLAEMDLFIKIKSTYYDFDEHEEYYEN